MEGTWFMVKVATLTGKVCTVGPVQAKFPLAVVKAMLHYQFRDIEGIQPPPQQRLVFNGHVLEEHVLEDSRTLEDYGIEHNSILQLVIIQESCHSSIETIREY